MKKEYIYNTDAVSIRSNDETGEQIIFGYAVNRIILNKGKSLHGWKLTNKQTI